MSTTQPETFKVGQLARSMGLTVRTLHHYDALGLVRPSARTAAGHRVYSAADVQRLYQVVALRQLGLSLDAVATVVGGTDQLAAVLAAHHDRLNQQLAAVRDAVDLVAVLRDKLHGAEQPSTGDFLELIRKVVMADETVKKYFDSHQLAELEERHQQDPESASRVQQGWAELLPEVDAALAAGTDPTSARGQALATRWNALLAEFHHGDAGLDRALKQLQADNAEEIEQQYGGPTQAQIAFITAATASS